jgi:hypothetical protein
VGAVNKLLVGGVVGHAGRNLTCFVARMRREPCITNVS